MKDRNSQHNNTLVTFDITNSTEEKVYRRMYGSISTNNYTTTTTDVMERITNLFDWTDEKQLTLQWKI